MLEMIQLDCEDICRGGRGIVLRDSVDDEDEYRARNLMEMVIVIVFRR